MYQITVSYNTAVCTQPDIAQLKNFLNFQPYTPVALGLRSYGWQANLPVWLTSLKLDCIHSIQRQSLQGRIQVGEGGRGGQSPLPTHVENKDECMNTHSQDDCMLTYALHS